MVLAAGLAIQLASGRGVQRIEAHGLADAKITGGSLAEMRSTSHLQSIYIASPWMRMMEALTLFAESGALRRVGAGPDLHGGLAADAGKAGLPVGALLIRDLAEQVFGDGKGCSCGQQAQRGAGVFGPCPVL